jgi:50S ribosomal protein L16 3-hydroxylase
MVSARQILLANNNAGTNESRLLGGLSHKAFLHQYWQKKPLMVRGALPDFQGLLSGEELINLACREDSHSRVITQRRGKWQLAQGPFTPGFFSRLPKKKWTLLVQDINHFLPAARELLLQFNFIPHSRLDDLMVSYATIGGGAGPHFDSYDVFLLQGMGRRCWKIAPQLDQRMIEDAPIKILRSFTPAQEWVLEPGDMLYLPPFYAHHGIASSAHCMTYSIGFRAPSYQELATQFLIYLQDHASVEGMYRDPEIGLQSRPGHISLAMVRQAATALEKIKWTRDDVARFIGIYLTEPKSHVFFSPPPFPASRNNFAARIRRNGLRLDLKSRMLYRGRTIFLNGDAYIVDADSRHLLQSLADHHRLANINDIDSATLGVFYQWYRYGYLEIGV